MCQGGVRTCHILSLSLQKQLSSFMDIVQEMRRNRYCMSVYLLWQVIVHIITVVWMGLVYYAYFFLYRFCFAFV